MTAVLCKLTSCDLDACGQCRRCGSQSKASHDWSAVERDRPCFRRESCNRCKKSI